MILHTDLKWHLISTFTVQIDPTVISNYIFKKNQPNNKNSVRHGGSFWVMFMPSSSLGK